MSPVLLEALLLFVVLFTTLAMIGCVDYVYQLAKWWHEQRLIPRPVQVAPLRGEVTLFESRQYTGELFGLIRLGPEPGDGPSPSQPPSP